MELRWKSVSETLVAGVKIAGLRQLTEKPGPPLVRDSNRQMSRVEADASYRKQRMGATSTRHTFERSKCN